MSDRRAALVSIRLAASEIPKIDACMHWCPPDVESINIERAVFHQPHFDPSSDAHWPHYTLFVTWILKSALIGRPGTTDMFRLSIRFTSSPSFCWVCALSELTQKFWAICVFSHVLKISVFKGRSQFGFCSTPFCVFIAWSMPWMPVTWTPLPFISQATKLSANPFRELRMHDHSH